MPEETQRPLLPFPASPLQRFMVILAIICGVGFLVWGGVTLRTVLERRAVRSGVPPSVPVTLPSAWQENGIPSNVIPPAKALHETLAVPGYASATPKSIEAVTGTDGLGYWAVKTEKGVTTVKAQQ